MTLYKLFELEVILGLNRFRCICDIFGMCSIVSCSVAAREFMAPGVKAHIRRPLQTCDSSETVGVARFVERGYRACASLTLFLLLPANLSGVKAGRF